MKRLVIAGCGSVGRRHAENASKLCEVGLFDIDANVVEAASSQLGVRGFFSLEDALEWNPDGVVVATPTHTHLRVARAAISGGIDVLVEKPISHSLNGVEEFLSLAERLGRQVFVACNMRFHPAIGHVRDCLKAIGRPYFAKAQYGHYLPDMRPGRDYRELYCSKSSMGGGVILDAIHEIDYLMWFFGPVETVLCEAGKLSSLDIDVEDYACFILRHENGIRVEIHLDYLQRCKRRGVEIAGELGTLVWLSEGKQPERCQVRLFRADKGHWETVLSTEALEMNTMYEQMLGEFVRALDGESVALLTGREAARELGTALAVRDASQAGVLTRPISIP